LYLLATHPDIRAIERSLRAEEEFRRVHCARLRATLRMIRLQRDEVIRLKTQAV
jgi:hypothetical protein